MPFFVVTRGNGRRDGLIELITEGFQRKTIRGYIAMTSLPKKNGKKCGPDVRAESVLQISSFM
jgi:hypothetical protein